MYFPAEHIVDKLQISREQLSEFEEKGIVHGIAKVGTRLLIVTRFVPAQGNTALHD